MLDQHSGIRFTETSFPGDITYSLRHVYPSLYLFPNPHFFSSLVYFSGLSLSCLLTNMSGYPSSLLLASSTTINSRSSLLYLHRASLFPVPPLPWGGFGAPYQPHSPCCLGTREPQQSSGCQDMATFKF